MMCKSREHLWKCDWSQKEVHFKCYTSSALPDDMGFYYHSRLTLEFGSVMNPFWDQKRISHVLLPHLLCMYGFYICILKSTMELPLYFDTINLFCQKPDTLVFIKTPNGTETWLKFLSDIKCTWFATMLFYVTSLCWSRTFHVFSLIHLCQVYLRHASLLQKPLTS